MTKTTSFSAALLAGLLLNMPAMAGDTAAPEGAEVYFINIADGDTLSNPVTIQFGLKGMGVSPAGIQDVADSGHHHLLINSALTGDALNAPIPSDDSHRHFGKGQTEVTLDLPAGTHTLQLVLGDWKHTPHDKPVMSEPIKVTVE